MMKLTTEDGIADPQVGYVDGYLFEERLLEGVRFKVEPDPQNPDRLMCLGVHPGDAVYMEKFSKKSIAEWCELAARHAEADECQDENNQDLYWENVV